MLLSGQAVDFHLILTSHNLSNKLLRDYLNFRASQFYKILQLITNILIIRFEICKDVWQVECHDFLICFLFLVKAGADRRYKRALNSKKYVERLAQKKDVGNLG